VRVYQFRHIRVVGQMDRSPEHRGSAHTANGIRTRVTAVRGRRPSPLDDGGLDRASRLAKQTTPAPTEGSTAPLGPHARRRSPRRGAGRARRGPGSRACVCRRARSQPFSTRCSETGRKGAPRSPGRGAGESGRRSSVGRARYDRSTTVNDTILARRPAHGPILQLIPLLKSD
jgi:hypothetical protein